MRQVIHRAKRIPIFFSCSILFYVVALPCFASFIETSNIDVIQQQFMGLDPKTLVIFDVDDVLMQPSDQILKKQNEHYCYKNIQKKLEQKWPKKKFEMLYSIIAKQRELSPVTPKMKSIIRELQEQKIKVLALTNCGAGRYGKIASLVRWRIKDLKKLGYHFNKSWIDTKSKTFYNFNPVHAEVSGETLGKPTFSQGVIFTSNISKGEVLQAFLKTTHKPTKIIFIDDKKDNLESVQQFAMKNHIPFVGIQYTATAKETIKPLNTKRVDFQYDFLVKHQQWISDAEADRLLAINP